MTLRASGSMVYIRGWLRLNDPPSAVPHSCFCVLEDSHLALFESDKSESPLESIDVGDVARADIFRADSAPSFKIHSESGPDLVFTCTSMAECERWLDALQHPCTEKVTIDNFDILVVIGRGASGKVMLAKKKDTGVPYAIKSIRKDRLAAGSNKLRIIAELNTLKRTSHHFITHLHYAFQTERRCYFVMEYVSGGDLWHHLNRGVVFSPFQIQLYLAEIIVALKQLHQLGIIYRDLKPENILLDKSGHIKLTDFGLARELDRDPQARYSLCGTYEYLAPEMIRSERQTFEVDWWALGVLTYRLLVGILPFQSDNRKRLFDMILRRDPRIPPQIDKSAKSLIQGLLQKDPTKRLGKDIESHEYFKGLSWERIAAREYDPPFKPVVPRDDSVSNFDEIFTSENTAESFAQQMPLLTVPNFSFQEEVVGRDE